MREQPTSALGQFALVWGIVGVCGLLGSAVVRLAPRALEPVRDGMDGIEWAAYAGSIVVMAYSEGYKGFQKNYSPRVVARALHLRQNPIPLHVVLAPFFCMALFHATRVRLIVAWTIPVAVIILVAIVRGFAQPWRGIVDAGVVVGLSWGLVAILAHLVQGLRGQPPVVDPGLPTRPGESAD